MFASLLLFKLSFTVYRNINDDLFMCPPFLSYKITLTGIQGGCVAVLVFRKNRGETERSTQGVVLCARRGNAWRARHHRMTNSPLQGAAATRTEQLCRETLPAA